MDNYLLDNYFLRELFEQHNRETYVRITALNKDELPIESIEGQATGGTINLDGSSAVRRSCNITLVAENIQVHDYYWGLKNKFRLKIGLKNTIDNQYPDICWFDYGVFVIQSFSCSSSTNNFTVSIQGKDKLSLLNGELSGNFFATTELSKYLVQNDFGDTIASKYVPIEQIIKNLLVVFGGESLKNIVIEDLAQGVKYIKYKADEAIYGDSEEGEN